MHLFFIGAVAAAVVLMCCILHDVCALSFEQTMCESETEHARMPKNKIIKFANGESIACTANKHFESREKETHNK